MNKPSSTTLAVIGGLVIGHALFSLRYPDDWLMGIAGLVLVIAFYIAMSRRAPSSTTEDVDESAEVSGADDQEPIDKEKARDKRRFIKVTF